MISFLTTTTPLGRLLNRRAAGRTAVGIDVGSRAVKAVQLERPTGPDGRPRVVAATVRPRVGDGPLRADEAAAVAEGLVASGFLGDRVVLAAPGDALMVGPLELPPRGTQAPLDQLARMEVARNFRCPPESFELAWWEVPAGGRGGRGTQALAVAMPHAGADALLDAVERPGLTVAALDAGPVALVRACRPALAGKGITAVLDLGWGPATLSLVYQGVLTFGRRIPEGAFGPLQGSLGTALGVEPDVAAYLLAEVGLTGRAADGPVDAGGPGSDDEADPVEMPADGGRLLAGFVDTLARELLLSFAYAGHQYPDAAVAELLLVGGGAGLAGLAPLLASTLGVEVRAVAPADVAECEPSLRGVCSSPALTLALGLAMRELEGVK